MDYLSLIPRPKKGTIAEGLKQRLSQRKADGPAEPALDVFIDEVSDLSDRLGTHVIGKTLASAARATRLVHRNECDDNVGTWFRHIESYLSIEGHRRTGPHVAEALALHKAVCPNGLAHLDKHVPEQNVHCHAALQVLRAPEHAATIAGIGLPMVWVDSLEASLLASDAAHNDVVDARTDTRVHVGLGRNVETDWVDTMRRLRRQIASRGRRGGAAKKAEGMQLLEPLLVVLEKMHAEKAARTTRKGKKKPKARPPGAVSASPAPASPPGDASASSPTASPPRDASASSAPASPPADVSASPAPAAP